MTTRLHIDPEQPPSVRKLEREVAAALKRLAASEQYARAELSAERDEAVIPVVVAWNGEEGRPRHVQFRDQTV